MAGPSVAWFVLVRVQFVSPPPSSGASMLLVHVHLAGCGRMSRSQRRRGRGALCERGASVCTESEGQERLDWEQVTRDGVRWPVVMRRLR
eukprot:scaffold16443_cov59-Phaeocystis_antarctica.AAC.1